MTFIYKEQYAEIASLIHERKFRRAIAVIHKDQMQSEIPAIMNYYNGWECSDDSIYDFLEEYIDRGKLSYKANRDKGREGHVLTDVQKELDKKFYPRRKEVMGNLMRHFVLRLLKRGRNNARYSPTGMELFSFRTLNNYVIGQLERGLIQVTNPNKFNDPFDCLVLSGIRKHRELLKTDKRLSIKSYVKELSRIRVCCFAGWDKHKKNPPYLNTLMWSHYANNHKGICIKYSVTSNFPLLANGVSSDHSRNRLDKVIYKKSPVAKKNILSFGECFLIKDKVWDYENEIRLIHYDTKENGNYITLPLAALGLKIEAVYFGMNCPPKKREQVEKILEGKGVFFYTLGYDSMSMNRICVIE